MPKPPTEMYAFEEIRHVHLEPTTKCNAACPMCARNACGSTAPGLALTELSASDVAALLPTAFLAHVDAVDLCGAYGDPAAAHQLIGIVRHIRDANPACRVSVFTNGGIRSTTWWADLAKAIGRDGLVVFGIDGLAETNSIYRRGVDFEKTMANTSAFIAAGGRAQWDFIAFRHNEHQIETARALSDSMGFAQFSVKRTARFLKAAYDYVPELAGRRDLGRFPVHTVDGSIVGYLEPPRTRSLRNETAERYPELIHRFKSLDALFDATPISCRVLDTHSVFISAEGYAFPCCWTYVQATTPKLYGFPEGIDRQVYDLVEGLGGFDAVNTLAHGLRTVVEGPLFRAIEDSWACRTVGNGRLKVCARVCGVEFPAYANQFANAELIPGSA